MPRLPNPFSPEATAARRGRLRAVLASEHQAEALLVSDPLNIRYLSGFDGSNGALLVLGDDAVLFTDSRYLEQASQQAPGLTVVQARDVVGQALRQAPADLLLEGHHLSAAQWEQIRATYPRATLVDDLVAELRRIKDDAETRVLVHACRVTQQALATLIEQPVLGRTERDIARQLAWLLACDGGEGPGFDSIVAGGPNSAIPHHRPGDRELQTGDLLKIDFGAKVHGYHADFTRTFVVAADPQPWQRDLHALVHTAQRAGRQAVAPGRPVSQVDAAARTVIADAGLAEHFGHGLGHGVGLAIHERPLIAAAAIGTLEEGMAVTIEPGVYLPGRGGVRIEDTVLVTAQGCRMPVTLARELVTVP